ncbi:MAG: LysR substrate-binding domain-containing protein [Pseudomonadota bacterium]
MQQFRAGRSGRVRVGGTPFFMDGVIAAILGEFQSEQPNIRIDQSYAYSTDLIESVASKRLDLAICPLRVEAVPDGLTFEEILPGLNVIACRVAHPLSRRGAIKPADIMEYPWIAPPVESPLYEDLRQAVAHVGATALRISFSGGSLASVVNVLTGSDALTVLPYSVVHAMRRQRTITALSLKIGDPDRHLGLLFSSSADPSPAARRLRSFLTSRFDALAQRIALDRRQAFLHSDTS